MADGCHQKTMSYFKPSAVGLVVLLSVATTGCQHTATTATKATPVPPKVEFARAEPAVGSTPITVAQAVPSPVAPQPVVEKTGRPVVAALPSAELAEPKNLSLIKAELVRYHDSGAYERDLVKVAGEAQAWIEQRAAKRKNGEKLAVVFDIDETVLSGWESIQANDFGFIPERWIAWSSKAEAPAIMPVKPVYETALGEGVAVFFITSRREYQRSPTELNLQRQGYVGYARLLMQPTGGDRLTNEAFKTVARERLAREGYVIIANIGDQQSDLDGGFAEKTFKLPNPFYQIE